MNDFKEAATQRFIEACEDTIKSGFAKNKTDLAKNLQISKSKLSEILNKRMYVGLDNLATLSMLYGISSKWLLSGEGEMLEANINKFNLRTDNDLANQAIPLYSFEATAGLVDLFQHHGDTEVVDTISIPNLPKCDGAVPITGDSMYPLLKSGDIVIYKIIHDKLDNIFWGEMYLVSVQVEDEEFVSVKYIQKSDRGPEWVKLVSQNQHHQPKDVHIDKIRALAMVKASIRINAML